MARLVISVGGGSASGRSIRFSTVDYPAFCATRSSPSALFPEGVSLAFGSLQFCADGSGTLRLWDPAPLLLAELTLEEPSSAGVAMYHFVGMVHADSLLPMLEDMEGYDSTDNTSSVAEVFMAAAGGTSGANAPTFTGNQPGAGGGDGRAHPAQIDARVLDARVSGDTPEARALEQQRQLLQAEAARITQEQQRLECEHQSAGNSGFRRPHH